MADVRLAGVSKRFGSVYACADVDLAIADGEFVTLLGPSGCGKTTTLNLIAGLEDVTSGEVRIGGRVVNDLGPFERDIAMVFQNYALYPHMTVAENIGFTLRLRKRPKDEIRTRVARVAETLELEHLLERLPRELSGGQQQRVALGRALVREPAVFLFDEPFSNLDAALRVRMRTEIRELHQRLRVTSVFVTHDQEEAMSISDRVAIMRAGRVEQVGTPEQVYARPDSTYVARFIGSPQMELLAGAFERGPDGVRYRAGGLAFGVPEAIADRLSGIPVDLGIRPEHIGVGVGGAAPGGVGPAIGGVGPAIGGVGPAIGGVGPAIGGVGPAIGGVGPAIGAGGHPGAGIGGVPAAVRPEPSATATVRVVQPLGPMTYVSLTWDGGSLTARLPGMVHLAPGQPVSVALDPDHLLFFDRASGRRIHP
jgi:ABC-type sugar transport system ATPase subunit